MLPNENNMYALMVCMKIDTREIGYLVVYGFKKKKKN